MLPHNLSRCTGITGTSNPSTSFSMPLLNGSKFPVREIAPSAKNTNHMPRLQLLAGILNRPHHIPRPRSPHWNSFRQFEEPMKRRHLVVRLPDHESDEPLQTSPNQHPIHMRHMIRDQQRRPTPRNILRPHNPNLENRVRDEPQHEPHQKLRRQHDNVNRHSNRQRAR